MKTRTTSHRSPARRELLLTCLAGLALLIVPCCGASSESCDDGLPCTVDTNKEGRCLHALKSCDDHDPCTLDACRDADGVCVHDVTDGCTVGPAACGDGYCQTGEGLASCPADCKEIVDPGACGDGDCDGAGGETKGSCPEDCALVDPAPCGDGACDAPAGETATSCPADCAPQAVCGDTRCDPSESTATCPADCPATPSCGDETCSGGETPQSCPEDCATVSDCGDGLCSAAKGEDEDSCPEDCDGPPAPVCGDKDCESAAGEDASSCPEDCGGEACSTPADCDDAKPCTSDTCDDDTGQCAHSPVPDCPSVDSHPMAGLTLFKDGCDKELWGHWTNDTDFAITEVEVLSKTNTDSPVVASVSYAGGLGFTAGFPDVWRFFDDGDFPDDSYVFVVHFEDLPDLVLDLPVVASFYEDDEWIDLWEWNAFNALKLTLRPWFNGRVQRVDVYDEARCRMYWWTFASEPVFEPNELFELTLPEFYPASGSQILVVIQGLDDSLYYSFYQTMRVAIP